MICSALLIQAKSLNRVPFGTAAIIVVRINTDFYFKKFIIDPVILKAPNLN
jgi:hypothetical protein